MSIKVEEANIGDLSSVQKICQNSLPIYYSLLEFLAYQLSTDNFIYVIKKDNEILGYLLVNVKNTNTHILSIAVSEEHRSNGYGSVLIKEFSKKIKQKFKNIESITLYVMMRNIKAIKFYKENGFEFYSGMKNYYGPDEDALKLKKVL